MSAVDKTDALVRVDLPLSRFVKDENNPNKMSQREFDLLVDNMQMTGFTDPVLGRPLDQERCAKLLAGKSSKAERAAAIINDPELLIGITGGHHRYDAAEYLGFATAPVTIIVDPGFDDEASKFQMVRMNVIRGKMDPQKFFDLYNSLAGKYSDAIMADAFGFAEEAEFKRLITQTAKAFTDPTLQKKFKEAAAEIKTVDGLAKLLNQMFSMYGDTLPFGYMIFDHAGQRSMWLRVSNKTMASLGLIGELCVEQRRTVDDIVGYILRKAGAGNLGPLLQEAIDATTPVDIPEGFTEAPTKDALGKYDEA